MTTYKCDCGWVGEELATARCSHSGETEQMCPECHTHEVALTIVEVLS